MSTSAPNAGAIDAALTAVPAALRSRVVRFYGQLKQSYLKGDYDACGARAGKFAETLIRILQNSLEGGFTGFGTTINLYDEARRLERLPGTTGPEALRVFLPRALTFLYTLRNKRGFAHVGGDVDSEAVDAVTCVRVADWCLCELIRVVHGLSLEEAQTLVDALAIREAPDVWAVAGKKRVLRKGLSAKDQVLLLLYSDLSEAVLVEDLFEWVEYGRSDHFKARVLGPLHADRFVEWDKETDTVLLSPTGAREVERRLLIT